ncbi:hypothetical protein T484DRAFT_1973821 [Baffinella frigidus]|nr:hypothetical protein T484DRAFT_1973821 [Cryptophyta sp. CCMP2293]
MLPCGSHQAPQRATKQVASLDPRVPAVGSCEEHYPSSAHRVNIRPNSPQAGPRTLP